MRLDMTDGAMLKPGQTRVDRMDFTYPGLEGLFFAGDTTRGEGVGGDIAFDSALKTSELVLEYLRQ
jgi:hypothetical protein